MLNSSRTYDAGARSVAMSNQLTTLNDISQLSSSRRAYSTAKAYPKPTTKTHFAAATSIFIKHKGSLQDKDKGVEKMLNEYNVKQNLSSLVEKEQD